MANVSPERGPQRNRSTNRKIAAEALVQSSGTTPHATEDSAALLEQKIHEAITATTDAIGDEKLKQLAAILSGTRSIELLNLLLHQVESVQNNTFPCSNSDANKTAMASLVAMKPQNFLEAALIAQMIQIHHAMSEFLRRATHPEQTIDAADRNVNRAVRLGRLFTEQVEALQKLRGQSGQQKVVVEHVNVARGGQASLAQ